MGNETIRAFLALPIAEYFQASLKEYLDVLKPNLEGVKWVDPGQIHMTFHFFGDLEIGKISKISKIMHSVIPQYKAPELSIQGIGYFPNLQSPRVIWADLVGDVAVVERLQLELVLKLKRLGFPVEKRPFRAHATLGRVKNPVKYRFNSFLHNHRFATSKSATISKIVLFRSHLSSAGPRYEEVESVSFSS